MSTTSTCSSGAAGIPDRTHRVATWRISPPDGYSRTPSVITAHGELDAANAQEFVDYALRHAARINRLVLDLSGVEFFGTSGFSALHTLNVRCAGESIEWALGAQRRRHPAAADL